MAKEKQDRSMCAVLRSAKVSPRKARLVVDLVRGRPVQEALDILRFTKKKSAPMVSRLIRSALSNLSANSMVDEDNLVLTEARVDDGRTEKRFMPRAQGRASPLRKRTSHISIKLGER